MYRLRWFVAMTIAACSMCVSVRADEPKSRTSTPESDPQNPGLWNTDAMMESAVIQLTKRYNLNAEQEAYTRKLLTSRVRAFLKEHESELRSLLTEAIDLQRNPAKVDARRMESWSKKALPVFQAARVAILDGNHEWGEILNPDQKRIHQQDLDQMDGNFKDMDEKFTRWSSGGYKPEDMAPRRQPPPTAVADAQRGSGNGRKLGAYGSQSLPEDYWEFEINKLIKQYQFTKEQEVQARGILQDCRNQAARFRESHKDQLKDLLDKSNAARDRIISSGKKANPDEYRKADAAYREALKPITEDIFQKMKTRVEALATAEQRAKAADERALHQRMAEEARQRYEERMKAMTASRPAAADGSSGGVGQPLRPPAASQSAAPKGTDK